MDTGKLLPPGFTSDDTSYEASLSIPFLSLGVSTWIGRVQGTGRIASFRQRDTSGNYISSLFTSHTLTVIRNPSQIKTSPSKITIREAVDTPYRRAATPISMIELEIG